MKKTIQFTYALLKVLLTYAFFVIDNIFCIFGIGTKLPFKDFVKNFYTRKLAYVRITVGVFIYFLWKLIF